MFKVGDKVELERTPIYASTNGSTYRQSTKEIARVHEATGAVQFKGQKNYQWFSVSHNGEYLETRKVRYRIIG
jgi:hypothetical protein